MDGSPVGVSCHRSIGQDPTVFLFPALRVEDGKDIFAYFYSHAEPREMLRFKAGYIPLLPNIIGYGLLLLPTRWIPYGFVAVPFLFSLLTYSLFFAPVYRYYIKSDVIRATICILFPLAPFFHYDIHFSVDYIIWNALLLLSLILMLPAPHGWRNLPWLLLVSILIFSNPLTIVFVPIFVYRLFTDKRSSLVYALSLIIALTCQLVGVQKAQVLNGIGLERAWHSMVLAFVLIVKQAYKAFFGTKIYMISTDLAFLVFFLFSLLSLAVYLRFPIRSRLILVVYSFYISYATILLSIFTRGVDKVAQIETHMRYMYVASMLTYVLAFSVLETLLQPPGITQGGSAKFSSVNGRYWADVNQARLICLPVLSFYFLLNVAMGYYGSKSWVGQRGGWYSSDLRNGQITSQFFSRLADVEQSLCAGKDFWEQVAEQPLRASKENGDWSFEVYPKCRYS